MITWCMISGGGVSEVFFARRFQIWAQIWLKMELSFKDWRQFSFLRYAEIYDFMYGGYWAVENNWNTIVLKLDFRVWNLHNRVYYKKMIPYGCVKCNLTHQSHVVAFYWFLCIIYYAYIRVRTVRRSEASEPDTYHLPISDTVWINSQPLNKMRRSGFFSC